MAKTVGHSKLPWDVYGFESVRSPEGGVIVDTKGLKSNANAEFIVKAVNNHERLLDLLRVVSFYITEYPTVLGKIEEAIKAVEGE